MAKSYFSRLGTHPGLGAYPRAAPTMETLYSIPFFVLEAPQLRLRKPGFLKVPSAMMVFGVVLLSYFLVTGGLIYDVIVEPPSVGSTTDEYGNSKPEAFMQVCVVCVCVCGVCVWCVCVCVCV